MKNIEKKEINILKKIANQKSQIMKKIIMKKRKKTKSKAKNIIIQKIGKINHQKKNVQEIRLPAKNKKFQK